MKNCNIESLEEYLYQTNISREQNNLTDTRYRFFHLKKLDKLMIMKKSVTVDTEKTSIKTSTTSIRELKIDKSLNNTINSALNNDEMPDFIMTNQRKIFLDTSESAICGKTHTRIDTFAYDRDPEYYLEYLFVEKPYRNYGLATELINEAKNSSINNNVFKLTGAMIPIDSKPSHFLDFRRWINKVCEKTGKFKKLSYVDYETLWQIYTKLGFQIDDNPKYTDPKLLMKLTENSIPEDKKLPDEFTRFLMNKHTTLLFK